MENRGLIRSSMARKSPRDEAAPSEAVFSVALCLRESPIENAGTKCRPTQPTRELKRALSGK